MDKINSFSKTNNDLMIITSKNLVNSSSTSKGNQIKWCVNNIWYKSNSLGYENVAEVIASLLADNIDNFDSVSYGLIKVKYNNNKIYDCDYSKSFLNADESIITFDRLLKFNFPDMYKHYRKKPPVKRLKLVMELQNVVIINMSEYVLKNILFDAIILNEDRHLNNLAFIKTSNGYKECPNFDNGLCLLSDLNDYPMNVGLIENIFNVSSKPFNEDFDTQIRLVKNMLGDYVLKININNFYKDLDKIDFGEYTLYKDRCIDVLNNRLDYYKNKIWEEI